MSDWIEALWRKITTLGYCPLLEIVATLHPQTGKKRIRTASFIVANTHLMVPQTPQVIRNYAIGYYTDGCIGSCRLVDGSAFIFSETF